MKKIRIDFCDFWPKFRKEKNFLTEVLRTRYEVEIVDQPDFLIFCNYGYQHRLFTCPRIFYTMESCLPNWRECDYALTYHYQDNPRHLRLPVYVFTADYEELAHVPPLHRGPQPGAETPEQIMARKTKFCAFVVSNLHPRADKRVEFFHRLSRYKQVDSGGRALNNIGGPVTGGKAGKQDFLRPYKFCIAFQNRSIPGYTDEKIYEAMLARCIPIFWGSPRIHEEFNPKSFLNYFDFPNEDALVDRIIEIDNNPELYLEYLRQPIFHNNQPNEYFSRERLLNFFDNIFTTPIQPIGTRRKFFQFRRWIAVKKHHARVPEIWAR
jgi:alpha(1,3/1,4) fucosyltransferase